MNKREVALEKALDRYVSIKDRFFEVFGLLLPEQTARFWAFWSSLKGAEKNAAAMMGRYPGGVMDWYLPSFDDWKLEDGLDHRLYFRYTPAPPEFVCVMTGDCDGLNYGLWYETPAKEPLCVTSFFARDDASISYCGKTILEAYRLDLEYAHINFLEEDELSEQDRDRYLADLDELRKAVTFFETSERKEVGSAYEKKYLRSRRSKRYETLDGFGVSVKGKIDWQSIFPKRPDNGYDLYNVIRDKKKLVQKWIEAARCELSKGNPYPALVLGRDLHACWGQKDLQPIALELMEGAYGKLGRQALAEIARVHHEHRDLRSVDVYKR